MYVYENGPFKGAELIISNGVASYMCVDSKFDKEVNISMKRFFQKDWVELSERTSLANYLLLTQHREPIVGMYDTSRGKIVIMASCFIQGKYEVVDVGLYSEVFHLYMANK